ncbi:MAG: sugar transferase [Actinomycetota bacterium]
MTTFAANTTGVSRGRRLLDVTVASAGLVLGSPVFAAVAVSVRLSSPGPVIFRQVRVGERGQPFTLYKFRSMTCADNPNGTPAECHVTAAGDPRVTRNGNVLRSTSLDEIPQLWNVLRGDMTLVGPRPETPRLAERYPPECRWVLQYRPGITGPCQLHMRDRDVVPPDVTDPEAYYVRHLVPPRVDWDSRFLSAPTLRATLALLWSTARYLVGRPMTDMA